MSTILWSFGIWSKLERWKGLISGCLMGWPQIKILSFWSVAFSYLCYNNEPFLDCIVTCDKKWILWQLAMTSSVVRLRRSSIILVQSLNRVRLYATPWTAACQASPSITNSWSLLKFMSIELVMPSNHLILCCPLLLPSIFPSIRVYSKSRIFASGGQSIGASASALVLPVNIQDWLALGLTGLISLQSKGLLRVFSNTTGQKQQFFGTQLSLWSNSHIHTWLLEQTIALTIWTSVNKPMSLLFNMLSRLVIVFLLRSKRLLISWL